MKNLHRAVFALLALLIIMSLLLTACGSQPAATSTPTANAQPVSTPTTAQSAAATPTAAAATTPTQAAAAGTPTQATAAGTPTAASSVAPTPAQAKLPLKTSEYSVQVFLWGEPTAERDMQKVKEMGFGWIKQTFQWNWIEGNEKGKFEWNEPDRLTSLAAKNGLKMLVRLDASPKWAFPNGDKVMGPPTDMKNWGDFIDALSKRYKGKIGAYAIWNEPNLSREWGNQPPDPAAYAKMLKMSYEIIKKNDPDAIVISAGLTPTGTNDQTAMPDDMFLEKMYQAMDNHSSKGYFDLLGVHAPGYKAAPETSPEEVAANKALGGQRFFAFRHVEDLRKIMEKYGDKGKQMAILEFGWTSDTVHPAYSWFAVSEQEKADYLVRAYQYAKKNWSPWMGIMSLIYISSPHWTKDNEEYWWAITNPDGTNRPAYDALQKMQK